MRRNEVCYITVDEAEPWSLETYLKKGGYSAWKKIIAGEITADEVLGTLKAADCAAVVVRAFRLA